MEIPNRHQISVMVNGQRVHSPRRFERCIATAPILSGFNGSVVGFGKITNPLWAWTVGDRIFLNGTSLSTTAPSSGFIQIIGVAIASDTIDIKLAQSILL